MPQRYRVPALTGVVFAASVLTVSGCSSSGGTVTPKPTATTAVTTAAPATTAPTQPATTAPPTTATTSDPGNGGTVDLSSDPGCNEAMNALLSAGSLSKTDPLKAATGLAAILTKLSDAAGKTKRPGAADAMNAIIADVHAAIKDGPSSPNSAADKTKLSNDTTTLANICIG